MTGLFFPKRFPRRLPNVYQLDFSSKKCNDFNCIFGVTRVRFPPPPPDFASNFERSEVCRAEAVSEGGQWIAVE
jgi:hypothetical protein